LTEYLKIIDPKSLYLIHPLKISFLKENGIYELIVKYIDFFSFDFFNKNAQIGYKNLSSGERTLFSQFTNIFKTIYQYKFDNYLIILDEPDNRLHPQWQKEYINLLIKFLKANFKDKNFHIILTTHSPFLISDLPKENIIFLDRDKNGNCIVEDGLKEKKQTFGANIHTLLSDSFFMEDGLMGEFAKSKIDEINKLLNKSS